MKEEEEMKPVMGKREGFGVAFIRGLLSHVHVSIWVEHILFVLTRGVGSLLWERDRFLWKPPFYACQKSPRCSSLVPAF